MSDFSNFADPVRVTEDAVTFAESDVTVTNNSTSVNNNSIELLSQSVIFDAEDNDRTTASNDWDGFTGETSGLTNQTGTVISGSRTFEFEVSNASERVITQRSPDTKKNFSVTIRIGSDTGNTNDDVFMNFIDSGTQLGNLFFIDGGGNVNWEGSEVLPSWSANKDYAIELDWNFGSDQVDIIINGTNEGTFSLRNSASDFDSFKLFNETQNSGTTRAVYFDDGLEGSTVTSGDALVEWDSAVPADIKAYDLATFQRTLDGETVTIDVEDGNGNILFSDIGQNFDISTVDTAKEVKLRANLSRSDTANNPTVDYLARRFTR